MSNYLALTVIADDRPGIVDTLAKTIASHQGNWMESSMARLVGKFAGVLLVSIDAENQTGLIAALHALEKDSIRISIENTSEQSSDNSDIIAIEIVANDRAGIVSEISNLLASRKVNLESLETFCESAPMSADLMFHAHAFVQLPDEMDRNDLIALLETVSADLMVEVLD